MFEKEAEEYAENKDVCGLLDSISEDLTQYDYGTIARYDIDPLTAESFKDGAEFGYNKANEELTERLDNATEIIELMKDLFFCCWQEKGLKAIKFEQRVNDFLKGE